MVSQKSSNDSNLDQLPMPHPTLPVLPMPRPTLPENVTSWIDYSLVERHHETNDGHVARHLEGHPSYNEHLLTSVWVVRRVIQTLGFP